MMLNKNHVRNKRGAYPKIQYESINYHLVLEALLIILNSPIIVALLEVVL